MQLSLIRQLWGIDKPWDEVLQKIRELDFDGIEVALPFLEPHQDYVDLQDKRGLQLIPMIFTTGNSVREHVASFRKQLEDAITFSPLKVTCHDGKDAFTIDDARQYYTEVLEIEAGLGVEVAHETHRGRILYNPWTTEVLLREFPKLRLCCDFSHWVCVCERLIDDQEEIIRLCADRTIHVHGRVGYNEGPQVPDPRAPEYQAELEAHERWWDLIWDSQQERGIQSSTFTPEFGPPPYMQTKPFTGDPASDLWVVSNWMAFRQRDRFADRAAQ